MCDENAQLPNTAIDHEFTNDLVEALMLLTDVEPHEIYNLAGQTSVGLTPEARCGRR
jgi:GDP-D-mannose dehydratase